MFQQGGFVKKNITFKNKILWSINKSQGSDVSDIQYNELQRCTYKKS